MVEPFIDEPPESPEHDNFPSFTDFDDNYEESEDFLEEWGMGHELADCYLSEDALGTFLAPPQENWQDFSPKDHATLLTMDAAKAKQWEMTKEEIAHIKKNTTALVGRANSSDVKDEDMLFLLLGSDSNIGKFLRTELGIDENTYLKFLHTMCIQAAYCVSVTQLFHPTSMLRNNLLLSMSEYCKIWKTMAEKRRLDPSEMSTSRREMPLWETVEGHVNSVLRSISIAGRPGRISIALDDDKVWMKIADASAVDLFNLKYTTHVRPNRKGIIGHTATSTGVIMPHGAVMERKKDSTLDCFKRMLDTMFKQDGQTNLRNVSIHSDRGYMLPNLVFEYLVTSGAEVLGTIKRLAQCWPFTFKQKLKESDKRTLIDTKGAPTLFLKWCRAGPKYVFASAFRNGTDSVATAISTLHNQYQWEGIVTHSAELEEYNRTEDASQSSLLVDKFFERVPNLGIEDESAEEKIKLRSIIETKIVPFTLRQGTADWHYMRKFSLTSSQAHTAFVAAFPAYHENEAWIAVATHLYGHNWREKLLPNDDQPERAGHESDNDENEDVIPNLVEYLNNQPIPHEDDHVARVALDFAKGYVIPPADEEEDSDEEDGEKELVVASEETATRIVRGLTTNTKKAVFDLLSSQIANPSHRKSNNTMAKDISAWLQEPNAKRSYIFFKVPALKGLITARKIKLDRGSKKREDIVDALVAYDKGSRDRVQEGDEVEETPALTPRDAAIKALLENSFQQPHRSGINKEHCSLGHRLEVPILKKWIQLATGPFPPVDGLCIKGAYSAGLAAKQSAVYAKDSVDFVVNVQEEGQDEISTWGFEAKGRVTAASAAEEERNIIFNFSSPHIRIDDTDVAEEISKVSERFQVLQHAFVYDFHTVVLAIADNQSELIRSIIIDYSTELKEKFGQVLNEIKNFSLAWAYPTLTPNRNYVKRPQVLQIPDNVMAIAKTIPTINGAHTMQSTANLWFTMCQHKKPIPSFSRLIPAIYAYWNAVKGGSDTTTKLMDDCLLRVPKAHMNTETVAITRFVFLLFVAYHRLSQVFSADALDVYPTLQHYRRASSHRRTFHVSLMKCAQMFKKKIQDNLNKENIPPSPVLQAAAQPQGRVTRQSRVDGILPQRIAFGPVFTSQTPTKLHYFSRQQQHAPAAVKKLFDTCTGMPMKIYPIKPNKCCTCQSKTSYYCVGCKRWFCFERRVLDTSKLEIKLYSHDVKGKKKTFQKTCFHEAHEQAWLEQQQSSNQESTH